MNALSRREEETLLKKTKAFALKACDPIVKGEASGYASVHKLTRFLHRIRRLCRRAHVLCGMGVQI